MAAFAQLLATERWVTCHCCSPEERREIRDDLLALAGLDRDALAAYLTLRDRETLAPVVPLRHSGRRGRSLPPV